MPCAHSCWRQCQMHDTRESSKGSVSSSSYPPASVAHVAIASRLFLRVVQMRSAFALCVGLSSLAVVTAGAAAPELPAVQLEHFTLQTAEQLFQERSRELLA